jgi:phosphate transport system substrate-binding protein
MGGTPIRPAPQEDVFDMMLGMVRQVANYSNYKNSLGYSFLYYARDMVNAHDIRFLSIDGNAPTSENIATGAYPFAHDFYAITVKSAGEYLNPERADNIDRLLEWIQGAQGQYLVKATGYCPASGV